MKKVLVIAATIVAVVLLGNVLLASAQGGTPFAPPMGPGMMSGYTGTYSGTLPMQGMMGWGNHSQMHSAMMAAGGMHEQVWTAVAGKLGMTYAELTSAVQNGQSVAQLAQAKGVSLDDLRQAALGGMKTALADLVKQGVITQQQADWMLDRMDDMPMFNFGQGFGPGMMGLGGQNGTTPNGFGPGMMGGRGMMGRWQQPTGPQG